MTETAQIEKTEPIDEKSEPVSKKPDRSKHHWSEADVCLLIERAYHGESWVKIGERLDRSPHACELKFAAIVEGESLSFALPPKTQELLFAHRKMVYPNSSPVEPDLRRLLERIHHLKLGTIALLIRHGDVNPRDVGAVVNQAEIELIAAMVKDMEGGEKK